MEDKKICFFCQTSAIRFSFIKLDSFKKKIQMWTKFLTLKLKLCYINTTMLLKKSCSQYTTHDSN